MPAACTRYRSNGLGLTSQEVLDVSVRSGPVAARAPGSTSWVGGCGGNGGSGGKRSRFYPPFAEDFFARQPFGHSFPDELADSLQLLERCALSGLESGGGGTSAGAGRTIRTYFSVVFANTIFPSVYMVFWS